MATSPGAKIEKEYAIKKILIKSNKLQERTPTVAASLSHIL